MPSGAGKEKMTKMWAGVHIMNVDLHEHGLRLQQ